MYRTVATQVDLPRLDHEILAFWRDNDVFARSLGQTQDRPVWVF